jgi:DNA repair protein SbcC/Rad50
MKFFSRLRKPDWEHQDAAIRLRAVQSGQQPPLLERLPEFAQRDPDADVRIAALRRVDDLPLLARRMRGENDERVAAVARERVIDGLCSAARPVEERITTMAELSDPAVLAAVAERAPERALRRAALERISRAGFLYERCLNDPDASLRLWLLERIDSPDALQRLSQAARKRDKTLTRAARERLQAVQLASGDRDALQRRILALCEQLERLGRELPVDRDTRLAALKEEWTRLQPHADADLLRRTAGYFDMTEGAMAAARGELSAPRCVATDMVAESEGTGSLHMPAAAIEAELAPALPDPRLDALQADLPPPDADDFDARARSLRQQARELQQAQPGNLAVDAQHLRLIEALDASQAQRRQLTDAHREQQRLAAVAAMDALEAALQGGNVAAARDARQQIGSGHAPAEIKRRLAAADDQLAKLDRWQRWSGHAVRQRLCDEAEALHGSGMHPDALATRTKELQAEWKRLDALEGEAAPPADSGIARRFRALCHRALAPARGYFEKRRELRGQRSEQVETLLQEATSVSESGSSAELLAMRRRLGEALHALDDVAPEKRGEQGRALRERRAAIDAALAAAREQAALEKRRLLARLRRDLGQADGAAATALAKDVQLEWKRLPRAERSEEDTLWAELRSLVDPLFEKVREQDDKQRAERAEADAAARAVLDELNALAGADAERLAHAEAQVDGLVGRWRALTRPDVDAGDHRDGGRDRNAASRGREQGRDQKRGGERDRPGARGPRERTPLHPLEADFNAALGRLQSARERAEREREQAAIANICNAGGLLDRLQSTADSEVRTELRREFEAVPLPADARDALHRRLASIDDGTSTDNVEHEGEALAVRAELSAGLESPAQAAEIRRQEQMQRLAAKLEGALPPTPAEEIRAQLVALQALSGLSPERRQALQQRISGAFSAVHGSHPRS